MRFIPKTPEPVSKPRKHFPAEKLSYANFLASCPGYPEDEKQELKPLQEFCGHKKSDWYDANLMVSPLDPHCADYFRYTAAGEIRPTTNTHSQTAAQTTIERLGLNHPKLDRRREKAIEGLKIADLTDDEIRQLIYGLNQSDANGELTPFCSALIYQLTDYLGN